MNYLERAFLYIRRKKSKTVLLLLLFLVANITILGTLSVLNASGVINQQIREKTNSKAILEVLDTANLLTVSDSQQIQQTCHIRFINRMSQCTAYPNSFVPVEGNEDNDDGIISLLGFDDMSMDSPFEDHVCRLIEGTYAQNANEVVINQNLADSNSLSIGDEIELMSTEGKTVRATISGFYLTGSERQQTESVTTVNRIENQIYTTTEFVSSVAPDIGFYKIAAYVDDPEQLTEVSEELNSFLAKKAEVRTIDTVYQKMKYSIAQIERITRLIFLLTVVTSIVVVEMLLCMWMRNRKVEIAVFISLGISKVLIFFQMLLEIWMLYVSSAVISSVALYILEPELERLLSREGNMELSMTYSITNALLLCGVGMLVLILLVGIAMIPCFRKKIKETLSEMEG